MVHSLTYRESRTISELTFEHTHTGTIYCREREREREIFLVGIRDYRLYVLILSLGKFRFSSLYRDRESLNR